MNDCSFYKPHHYSEGQDWICHHPEMKKRNILDCPFREETGKFVQAMCLMSKDILEIEK